MMQPYTDEQQTYHLSDRFHLQKANNKAFINYALTYRPANIYWADTFEHQAWELKGLAFCYWIYEAQTRVGGLLLLPHNIGEFFLIPPFTETDRVLQAVLPLLQHWSEQDRPIFARSILEQERASFEAFGFKPYDCWQWMMRPTSQHTIAWPEGYQCEQPRVDQKEEIAQLLHTAFAGGVGEYGQRNYEGFLWSVENFFGSERPLTIQNASTLLRSPNGELAGVTLVGFFANGHPCVNFIAVAPPFRGQQLARNMLQHALNVLHPNHNWLTLRVTVGNPAEHLYNQMGFMPAPPVYTLTLEKT